MDFFQQQENARRHTKWLVVYFIMAVAAMIATIYLVSIIIFNGVNSSHSSRHRYEADDTPAQTQLQVWNPQLFLGVSFGVIAVITIGSLAKTAELSNGGSAVAAMFGGRLINPGTTDPDERKLLNVIEEMSIASGVAMPQVFVLDDEQAINAFAAGHTPSDAAITVTRGCMKLLSRDELQGVIGHEFSHILNGDMRLNIRLMGTIFGIICLTVIGRILLQTGRGGGRRDKNPLPLLGLALIVVGGIGVFFGRLIQAAVSRQREFLADASSVQFTRNPSGLSGALQKIGRWGYGSRLESPHAEQASHMFFGNGISDPFIGLLATHPPISDRIHAIDPTWDGKFPPLKPDLIPVIEHAAFSDLKSARGATPDVVGSLFAGAIMSQNLAPKPVAIQSNTILPSLGQITTAHLAYAADLRNSIPQKLRDSGRDPLGAVALIYGLLLGENGPARQAALAQLATRVPPPVNSETVRLLPQISDIAARAKLVLVNLALPGLRQLSSPQLDDFSKTIEFLIAADSQVDLFEYVLQKIVRRHLVSQFAPAEKSVIQFYSSKPLLPECTILLSAIAHAGQDNDAEAQKAFNHGSPFLRIPDGVISLLPASACGLGQMDAALNRLAQAAPQIKKNVLEACAQTVAADGVVQEAEAELLRAVPDTLDCPIPPFVEME
ncbi:MAG TPA: M48 family metallopeptidase [Verrucomicrobiae bacterium]|nr:M48 family metallopeptidase [Verrucomicrobiae bacterium]